MAVNFTDHGGTVIQFVRAYLIFWGKAWASTPPPTPTTAQVANAVYRILTRGYMTGLAQYRGIGQGYILGSTTVTSSDSPNSFTDSNVSNFISGRPDQHIAKRRTPGPESRTASRRELSWNKCNYVKVLLTHAALAEPHSSHCREEKLTS